jgi:hypothetical protein
LLFAKPILLLGAKSMKKSAEPMAAIAKKVTWISAIWIGASILFTTSGIFQKLPVFVIPLLIWAPVLVCAVAVMVSNDLRRWLQTTSMKGMVAFHAVRILAGAMFLVRFYEGTLIGKFAWPAAIGDILVGIGALFVTYRYFPWKSSKQGTGIIIWNVLGLLDILGVFVRAQSILFFGEGISAMHAFFLFPGPLLPTWIVPWVLITHGAIFYRWFCERKGVGLVDQKYPTLLEKEPGNVG